MGADRVAAGRVHLVHPHAEHRKSFLAAVGRSRELHHPWTAAPVDVVGWDAHLARAADPANAMFHVMVDDVELAGVINLTNIVRGPFLSAYMGYYAFVPWHGRGVMRAGLTRALDQAFGPIGLHRVEANIQPENHPSIALVTGLGFSREGYSRRYLFLDGAWRDHERWAILSEDWAS